MTAASLLQIHLCLVDCLQSHLADGWTGGGNCHHRRYSSTAVAAYRQVEDTVALASAARPASRTMMMMTNSRTLDDLPQLQEATLLGSRQRLASANLHALQMHSKWQAAQEANRGQV